MKKNHLILAAVVVVASVVTVVAYGMFKPAPETVEACLRTVLASKMTSSDDATFNAAAKVAADRSGDWTISNKNASTFEARAISDKATWSAIATCRARFVDGAEPLVPPTFQVHAAALEKRGSRTLPVRDARVSALAQGRFCITGHDGTCSLEFVKLQPDDTVELVAVSVDGVLGTPVKQSLEQLVREGARLEIGQSYPLLTVSVTDCKTAQALAHGRVTANARKSQLWSTTCQSGMPPRRGECVTAEIAGGKARFFYDDAEAPVLELLVEPEGRPSETARVTAVTGNVIDVTYSKDCEGGVPSLAPKTPTCSSEVHGRIRNAARVPGATGQLSVKVAASGTITVLAGSDAVRARLAGQSVGTQPRACLASLVL